MTAIGHTPIKLMPQPIELMREIVEMALTMKASDIHLHANQHPAIRINGEIQTLVSSPKLENNQLDSLTSPLVLPSPTDELDPNNLNPWVL